jgi:transposase
MKVAGGDIGIDVSKAQLDIAHLPSGEQWTAANDETGIATLVKRLKEIEPTRVVLEATGGYEIDIAVALGTASIPTVVINPRQARDFARALNRLAKTDAIDARVLAEFGRRLEPEPRPLADDETRAMEALVARRRQLVDMRTAELNRQSSVRMAAMRDGIAAHIEWLDAAIKRLDKDISDGIRKSRIWRERDDLLKSAPGIGTGTSAMLITRLPELGRLTRKQIASLVGLAPLNDDSGTASRPRRIWGGRGDVRAMLYMATIAAIRCNATIKRFFVRLCNAGKPKKVALIAAMRKLLTILNAMVRDNKRWTHALDA